MLSRVEKKRAYVVRPTTEPQLRRLDQDLPLFGSDIFVDHRDGTLRYISYHDLPKKAAAEGEFIRISRSNPQGDIYAPYSRTTGISELRVSRINGVETAIRAMDHILESQTEREKPQAEALTRRAHELFDLFSRAFDTLSRDEFVAARQRTDAVLHEVKLNPSVIINEEKQRIVAWLLKGSTGQDSLGRQNKLIVTMALAAAYRRGIEKQERIGPITGKYIRMREALLFEREFARTMLLGVADIIRPQAIPADILFKNPDSPMDRHTGVVVGLLHTAVFQLHQPHAAPYMPAGREAAKLLTRARELLVQDKRRDIKNEGLFANSHALIQEVLESNRDIYQVS